MVLAFLAVVLMSAPAERVRWEAPPGCPDATQVVEDAEALSGRSIADAVGIEVEGAVRRHDGGGWVLALRIATASGAQERVLEAGSCDDLADVAATLLAVALQEPVVESAPDLEESSPEEPEPPTEELQPAPSGAPDAPEPWRAVLGAAGSVGLGALPGTAAVLSLSVGAERGRGRAEVEADVWLPRDARASGAEAGGSIALWTLAARGCGVPNVSPVRFPLCAGMQAGQMLGRGRGLDAPRNAALPWLAAEAVAGVRVDVHPNVAVRADMSVLVPMLRPGFTVDGMGIVHRAAVVGGTVGAGLEMRFP